MTHTYINQYGETMSVSKEGNKIVITHSDYPDERLVYKQKPNGLKKLLAAMSNIGIVEGEDTGEGVILGADEMGFIQETIEEQGW